LRAIVFPVRPFLSILFLLGSLAIASATDATGKIIKVRPLYLDLQGHDAISPSLYDRDAYQAWLREHTYKVSAIRFDVLWKTSDAKNQELKLRVELRGVGEQGLPKQAVLDKEVKQKFFRSWSSLTLSGDDYKNLGSLVAWRVTVWSGNRLLNEQKSFLW
jgi:hypothetical protein